MSEQLDRLIKWFRSQVGISENPKGSNNVIYNTEYYGREVYGDEYAWCGSFIWCGFNDTGNSKLFLNGGKSAYCPYIKNWAVSHDAFVREAPYKPGDILLYKLNGSAECNHIGFCVAVSGGTYTTVEGNYGDRVALVRRDVSEIDCAYRPEYAEDSYIQPDPDPEITPDASAPEEPPSPSSQAKKGDIVTILPGAHYWNGPSVPSWVISRKWIVRSVNGSRVLLGRDIDHEYNINSAIDIKYLTVYGSTENSKPETPDSGTGPGTDRLYTVKRGDTLWGLAEEFYGDGTKYSLIQTANGLKKSNIYVGQVLIIP